MNSGSPLETRVGALIAAYADRAPADVDPMSVARLAAVAGRSARPRSFATGWGGLSPALVLLLLALLAAALSGTLLAGAQLLRREPLSVQAREHVAIVAQYAMFHEGYVFVYEDGRVLLQPDLRASQSVVPKYRIYERRLSESGIGLVRSGAVPAQGFLHDPQLPAGAWADGEYRPYRPSRWATCFLSDGEPRDARDVVGLLPAPAQRILQGKDRIYPRPGLLSAAAVGPPVARAEGIIGEWSSVACSEVTDSEARRLVQGLEAADFFGGSNGPEPDFLDAGSTGGFLSVPDQSRIPMDERVPELMVVPVFPHGTWVGWGG